MAQNKNQKQRKKINVAKRLMTPEERRSCICENMNFAASEAYKLLRTNLIFSMSDESECKIVGMTSALRSEGKSTTSLNLAYTMAQTGKRVLLMEADMRIPVLSEILQMNPSPGLSHVLAGVGDLNEAVKRTDFMPNLYIIFAGEIPPNPSEMLSSKRMETVVTVLSKSFDYIIIDLPPINAVSDGLAVSSLLSGMVVVVRQNYCDHRSLSEAMRQMEFLKVKVLGFVYNDADLIDKRYKKYRRNGKYQRDYKYQRGYYKSDQSERAHSND